MRNRIKPLIDAFFYSYMTLRDVEKTMSLVTGQVMAVGTGAEDIAVGKKELRKRMEEEVKVCPHPVVYEIRDYEEYAMGEFAYYTMAHVWICMEDERGRMVEMETRTTIACCVDRDQWKIAQIHISVPSPFQEKGEFFPLKYAGKTGIRIAGDLSRELAELTLHAVPGGIMGVYLDEDFPLFVMNDKMLEILGYEYSDFQDISDEPVKRFVYPEDQESVKEEILESVKETGEYDVRYRMVRKNGGVIWVHDIGRKISAGDGRDAVIGVVVDISDTVNQERQLKREAQVDPLTGILNRKEAVSRVEKILKNDEHGMFFIIDVDNFKSLNDTRGHLAGDNALVLLSRMLMRSTRNEDVVARLGGDEFIVYFHDVQNQRLILQRLKRIQTDFAAAMKRQYSDLSVSLSIGGTLAEKGRSFSDLYSRADENLYKIKGSGKGQIGF